MHVVGLLTRDFTRVVFSGISACERSSRHASQSQHTAQRCVPVQNRVSEDQTLRHLHRHPTGNNHEKAEMKKLMRNTHTTHDGRPTERSTINHAATDENARPAIDKYAPTPVKTRPHAPKEKPTPQNRKTKMAQNSHADSMTYLELPF